MRQWRILVCGVGSIGERHIGNLHALGQESIAVHRTRGLPYRTINGAYPTFHDLTEALETFAPEIVLVCNPTALHLSTALQAARASCHVFVEKPVAHTLVGLAELEHILSANNRFGMVGYMMRFHPLMRQMKAWLDQGDDGIIGTPIYVRITWGEHVPDWHPWEDYATSYAVWRELGGGPALTYSHDLDAIYWLLGEPTVVAAMPTRTSRLAGDAEHGMDWLLRFENGAGAHVHADFYTRPPIRNWELIGTNGRFVFDYYGGSLMHYGGAVGERPPSSGAIAPSEKVLRVPGGFKRNDMFEAEIEYFLDCIEKGVMPRPNIADGRRVLALAFGATTR
jgi:predicted dehydrogenase